MELIEPNIHPVLVHFAFALTIISVLCFWLSGNSKSNSRKGLAITANWLLAFSVVFIILTVLAGLQAYYSVDHDGPSHAAMTTHRNWALGSGAAILLVALWRWMRRHDPAGALFKGVFTMAAMALSVTAWWGGHIVYNYGLGVKSLPVVTGDGHDHDHGSGDHAHNAAPTSLEEDKTTPVDSETNTSTHDHAEHDHGEEASAAVEVPSDGHADHDHGDHDHGNSQAARNAVIPEHPEDKKILDIIHQVEKGWEDGDGTPFLSHFLDYQGARYFESGGQNLGLKDLVENHVEPEKNSIPDLELELENIQIYYESDFAWAVGDTTVQGTLSRNGEKLDRTGKHTWLFRKVDGAWKIVHTHSSSRARRK